MAQALIGLGSNIEPRRGYLELAIRELALAPLRLLAQSQVYETAPMDVLEQDHFLNMAALVETELSPLEILRHLKTIEAKAHKTIIVRRGPRSLDLDLWAVEGAIHEDDELRLPHPRLPERPFVLLPLDEVAPQWRHPVLGLNASEMLQRLPQPWPALKPLGPL